MTQKSEAQKGNITPEIEIVAKQENMDRKKLVKLVDVGKIVIPKNMNLTMIKCAQCMENIVQLK